MISNRFSNPIRAVKAVIDYNKISASKLLYMGGKRFHGAVMGISVSRLLVYVTSLWIMVDGISAILLVYPPVDVWLIMRLTRVLIGGILILEAHRVRAKLILVEKDLEKTLKHASAYIDLLSLVGVLLVVDGVGTGLLNYVYPILLWQLIRLARVGLGISLALGAYFLWLKMPKVPK